MTQVIADLSGYETLDEELVGSPVKINGIPIGLVTECNDGTATIEITEKYGEIFYDSDKSWQGSCSQTP